MKSKTKKAVEIVLDTIKNPKYVFTSTADCTAALFLEKHVDKEKNMRKKWRAKKNLVNKIKEKLLKENKIKIDSEISIYIV